MLCCSYMGYNLNVKGKNGIILLEIRSQETYY
jgi:hypothetical protein